MTEKNFDSLLQATTAYISNMTTIFNTFLTVVFGSLAFAAAKPLKGIGGDFLSFSGASWAFFVVLLAFYIISFLSFLDSERHANALFKELHKMAVDWDLSEEALRAFNPTKYVCGVSLPSIGFVIGAAGNLAIFMWLSNHVLSG